MNAYNHESIEQKWQKFWQENNTFSVKNDNLNEKTFYALDMFPFPSGAGLHVGHPEGYTATDIICRKKRMEGFNVLHPMGWDAFGLPAENFAIKTGVHPKISTEKNIKNFKRQIQSLGFSYDWDREFSTTDENYYKWTQWLFLKFYEKGLLYEEEKPLNWCPVCKVVCANEEVEQGLHERCGNPVTKKSLKQWMFKITEYAERLLKDLEDPNLDWPEKIKSMQRNWIGKSTGINIKYPIVGKENEFITCYTTRPDTNFGATFVTLAPEHSFIQENLEKLPNYKEVKKYIAKAMAKSDIERMADEKKKTGVFTGKYVTNRINGKKLPIYVGDFVLSHVGTGAVVGVPGHDVRDFKFAQAMGIDIIRVVISPDGDTSAITKKKQVQEKSGKMINSDFLDGLDIMEAKEKISNYYIEKSWATREINYKLRDWIFTRQRYWGEPIPLVFDEEGTCYPLDESELPLKLPESANYEPSETGESPLAKIKNWVNVKGDITEKGTVKISENGSKNFTRETSTMPNWAGSSWYWLRYMDSRNEEKAWSQEAEGHWGQVDLYVGGAEHAVLHLLYSRFWHKALYDMGLVSTKEPFKKLVNQGLILSYAYENKNGGLVPVDEVIEKNGIFFDNKGNEVKKITAKMSKSLKNVVNPDEIIESFGADTLRLYEMFMGPFEQNKAWDTSALEGMHKFVLRIWNYFNKNEIKNICPSKELITLTHKTVKEVSNEIESFKFNTAISKLMVWLNNFQKLDYIPRIAGGKFIRLLSPFAPHIAEELWQKFSPKDETITFTSWPSYKEELIVESTVNYAVQINGKLRATFSIEKSSSKEECIRAAKNIEKIQTYLKDKTIIKEIFVKDKIIGFVIR